MLGQGYGNNIEMGVSGRGYWAGTIGVPLQHSPLAVLPGVARRAGGAAVPTASQTLTGPREPGGTGKHRGPSPACTSLPLSPYKHSLVFGVHERAGAGLAVLRGAGSGVPVEAGRTLVTEVPCRVVQAALKGGGGGQKNGGAWHWEMAPAPQKAAGRHDPPRGTYRAEATLGVAGLRVAVALAELAVPQVQPPPGTCVAGGTVLQEGAGMGGLSTVTPPHLPTDPEHTGHAGGRLTWQERPR